MKYVLIAVSIFAVIVLDGCSSTERSKISYPTPPNASPTPPNAYENVGEPSKAKLKQELTRLTRKSAMIIIGKLAVASFVVDRELMKKEIERTKPNELLSFSPFSKGYLYEFEVMQYLCPAKGNASQPVNVLSLGNPFVIFHNPLIFVQEGKEYLIFLSPAEEKDYEETLEVVKPDKIFESTRIDFKNVFVVVNGKEGIIQLDKYSNTDEVVRKISDQCSENGSTNSNSW